MRSTARRQTVFGITAVLLLIALIEIALRLVVNLSIDYVSRRESVNYEYRLWQMHLFNTFMGMHEPDPDLFWRLKPHFRSPFITVNSEGIAGPEIAAKEPGEYRILLLGDSTPLGLGLPNVEQSFVRQVETLLRARLPQRKITVINAAVAGYTSWQCRLLLEKIGPRLQPDCVITYFGNNDPSINGYLSDQQLSQQTRYSGALNRLLGHFYSYRLLKDLILRFKEHQPVDQQLVARVSVAEARANLDAIGDWCRENNTALTVCTAATPDLWPPGIQFKIFARGKDDEGRLVMADEMQSALWSDWSLCLDTLLLPGRADQWTQRVYQLNYVEPGTDSSLLAKYTAQLAANPADARAWNNLGVIRWRVGLSSQIEFERALAVDSLNPVVHYNLGIALYRADPAQSKFHLHRAKELDNYSLRIKAAYNDNYRDFCRTHASALAAVDSLLADLPENEVFVDHCHPTLRGHQLIAAHLAQLLAEALQ